MDEDDRRVRNTTYRLFVELGRAPTAAEVATGLGSTTEAVAAAPKQVFVTHGEAPASDALRQRIQTELGWNVSVPEYRVKVALS